MDLERGKIWEIRNKGYIESEKFIKSSNVIVE